MRHPTGPDCIETILAFLLRVGIEVCFEELKSPTFLPGIAVRDGTLVVDREALEWPGDLLHEAGHLAVLPSSLRQQASDALEVEHPVPHAGELEAMAWAYAAAVEINLPLTVLFHPGGYKGRSEALILTYSLGVFPGLPGLCATGMATAPRNDDGSGLVYPKMKSWLRER
jgi:hypothetical protein